MTDLRPIVCYRADCSATVWMTRDEVCDRQTSGASWFCPAGHWQAFTGQSADQKRIVELERLLRNALEERDYQKHRREAAERACPLPGCDWTASTPNGLRVHLTRTHHIKGETP